MNKKELNKLLTNIQQTYDAIASEFSESRQFIGKEFTLFKPYVQKNLSIADIGCGNGRLIKFLEQELSANFSYIGIDNSKKLLEEAQKQFPAYHFSEGTMQNIPLPDSSYDLLFCLRAFHHLPNKQLRLQALQEMHRILKPNGIIILTVWKLWRKENWQLLSKTWIKSLLSLGTKGWKDILVPWNKKWQRYYYAFWPGELKNLVKKANFKITAFYDQSDSNRNSDYIVIAKKIS